MNSRLNKYKYPGAKRLMLEAQELKDSTEDYNAQPIEDNLFEWHFTVRGPPDTAFDGGYYHGKLQFPTEYPMKPPSIILLTPNGRFKINKKICLSISGYHPETWQPSWSVRTALLALIAFMPTEGKKAIGSLDFSDAERKSLAFKSRTWRCETCGPIKNLLKHPEIPATDQENSQPQDDCKASTSRGCQTSVKSACDEQNLTTSNGSSDKSTDPSDATDPPNNSSSDSTSYQLTSDPQLRSKVNPTQLIKSNRVVGQPTPNSAGVLNDRRRSYPPLVFKSVFVLLSLLLLRRFVMVIQS